MLNVNKEPDYLKRQGKKILGIVLIMIGVFAFFTPFTPGSWLFFIGMELLGLRFLFLENFKKKLASINVTGIESTKKISVRNYLILFLKMLK